MASAKNVLVLDEPTNHLDIPSAERLEEGRWSDWERKLARSREQAPAPAKAPPKPAAKPTTAAMPTTKPAPKPSDGEKSKKSKWSWMRLEQLEERIEYIEGELKTIDADLADPDVWVDYERAEKLTSRRDELKTELEGVEAEWVRKAE
jgi:ATP-binding cassette subfamily F protein 3